MDLMLWPHTACCQRRRTPCRRERRQSRIRDLQGDLCVCPPVKVRVMVMVMVRVRVRLERVSSERHPNALIYASADSPSPPNQG